MTRRNHSAVRAGVATLALIIAWPSLAIAQDQLPAEPAQPGLSETDIIVTARRREESLQKVPVAITAVTGEMLHTRNIQQAGDLVAIAPSLQLQPGLEGRQAARFYVRGQGVGFGGAPPSVVTYFAEVPLDPNGGATFALNDMELAQVLRGPQGTLFGRNANGGAVVLVPKAPGNEPEAFIDLSAGNYAFAQAKIGATVPISDTLSVRFSGEWGRRDGYTKNISGKDYDNFDAGSWRIFLRWKPSDSFTNDLIYTGAKGSSNGMGTIIHAVRNPSAATLAYPVPGLPLVTGTGLLDDLAFQNAVGPRTIDSPASYFGEERELHLVVNTSTLDLGNATIKNIFGYEFVDACPSLPVTATRTNFFVSSCFKNYISDNAGVEMFPTTEQTQITEELNISGQAFNNRLDWILGGFLLWSDPKGNLGEFRATRAAKSLFVANVSSALPRDRSQAVYAQGTYSLTDQLKLTAGGRYTWDQRTLQFGQLVSRVNGAPGTFSCGTPGLAPTTPTADCVNVYKKNFKDYGYTFGLDWQASDSLMLYAQTRRGYKSGGFNSTSTSANPEYNPEILEDVELGAKFKFNTGSIRGTLNAAYFHAWYSAIQQQLSVVVANQATVITTNAGNANMDGVEVEANVTLFDRLNLTAAYSHIAASYNSCPTGVPASQLTPADCFVDVGQDVTKSKFVSTPKNTLNITASYTQPMGDAGDLVAFASYYTRSSMPFAADNVLNFEAIAPGYQVVNARLDWKDIFGSKLSVGLFANNLFNREYVASGLGLGGLIGTTTYIYGEPRTYGLNLRATF